MTAQLTYDEAADALGVSRSWLEKNIDRLPHLKFGSRQRGRVYFLPEHLDQIRAMHEHRPAAAAVCEPAGLRPVPGRSSRRKSA